MSRQPTDIAVIQHQVSPEQEINVSTMADAANALFALNREIDNNARDLSTQLGYSGALTVGALEDEIRFYQSRTIEACMELGKRLLILKELTPFGEFTQRVEMLGINKRMAQRFMSATLKFSKTTSKSLLRSSTSQTKLLELLVLDDSEIEALEDGDTVRGITLDAIEMMSVSELKKALRSARDDSAAKDSVIKKKDEKLNELDQALEKTRLSTTRNKKVDEAEMPGEYQLMRLQEYTRDITVRIAATLNKEIVLLFKEFPDAIPPQHIELAARQSIGLIISAAYGVADNMGIDPILEAKEADDLPAKADAEAFLEWQAKQQAGE